MNRELQIKVCGLRDEKNILEVAELQPDMMGFIFYEGSKRYVGKDFRMPYLPSSVKKTGVFVNANVDEILKAVDRHSLDMVQLHGDETVSLCAEVKKRIPVVKAFGVGDQLDHDTLEGFSDACTYFLFDTQTSEHGGSGKKFNWDLLDAYTGDIPFFLSGGIGAESVGGVKEVMKRKERLFAVDVNSRFEVEPGIKDIKQLKAFIHEIRG
jgi:phosphoribosylanthranilate isomerase